MKSRIAIFEGYGSPFRSMGRAPRMSRAPSMGRQRLGGPIFDNPRLRPNMGGPIFDNPRLPGLGALGRRGYYVPPAAYVSSDSRGGYGPGRRPRPGYKVKAKRDTPAQKRLARCSRKCSGRSRAKFKVCIRRCVKRKSKR